MKIKRFIAPDMRTALRMVRAEHGADAVILSNRRVEEGVEIVAASNYDEAMVQRTLEAAAHQADVPHERDATAAPAPRPSFAAPAPRTEAAAARPQPARPQPAFDAASLIAAAQASRNAAAPAARVPAAAPVAEPAPAPMAAARAPAESDFARTRAAALPPLPDTLQEAFAAAELEPARVELPAPMPQPADLPAPPPAMAAPQPALAAVPAPPAPQSDEQLAQMREELSQMRQMIEREMARLTDERLRGSPVRARAMELMEDYGFDAGITRDVALEIPADTDLARGRGMMLGLISRRLPICPVDPLHDGGVIALVGPTGAGKTTTIAKLAARYAAEHGARNVALVTTDTARIGGREQLYSYGRQLGVAVHEADSDTSLIQLLQRLSDYRLVLVDTAGLGQRDRALAGQLNWLRAARQVRTLLVLPANSHYADLDEVVRRFQHAAPQGVVLTKLDETGRLGSALSVIVDHGLPLTWITDGQHVPEDLHRANAASLALRLEDLRRAADKPTIPEHDHAVA